MNTGSVSAVTLITNFVWNFSTATQSEQKKSTSRSSRRFESLSGEAVVATYSDEEGRLLETSTSIFFLFR
jgi:hypothetical protein